MHRDTDTHTDIHKHTDIHTSHTQKQTHSLHHYTHKHTLHSSAPPTRQDTANPHPGRSRQKGEAGAPRGPGDGDERGVKEE